MNRIIASLAGMLLLVSSGLLAEEPLANAASLRFFALEGGEFGFDTGVVRGKMRPGGKSLGLVSVVHIPSGERLDQSNGLLSHYRVFTRGMRYGGGAWDWASQAVLRADGALDVSWPANVDRPFAMEATYRWRTPELIDMETTVRAGTNLAGFEVFVANYFTPAFTNAAVLLPASSSGQAVNSEFLAVVAVSGLWQMFPRDRSVIALIQDGRWQLAPNPVKWTMRPAFAQPVGFRRHPATGLTAVLSSPATDCFALAAPQQAESHYSFYLSLFGRDLRKDEVATARTTLRIGRLTDAQILAR